jgi:hypothetical protein
MSYLDDSRARARYARVWGFGAHLRLGSLTNTLQTEAMTHPDLDSLAPCCWPGSLGVHPFDPAPPMAVFRKPRSAAGRTWLRWRAGSRTRVTAFLWCSGSEAMEACGNVTCGWHKLGDPCAPCSPARCGVHSERFNYTSSHSQEQQQQGR